MSSDVAIIDGGGANIASLQFALDRLGVKGQLTTDASTIRSASHVILPGVGAAAAAMNKIRSLELEQVIPQLQQPVLGICLGMQLMAARSEEGNEECLGIYPETALRLTARPESPVPNMGWCELTCNGHHGLLDGIGDGNWFYFVHSYALPVFENTIGTAVHGSEFTAVVSRDNFHATQFHPERSSVAGSRLLKNFLEMK